MACGTPVIATDVGGLPDALHGLGDDLVVPAADVGALAERLRTARNGRRPAAERSARAGTRRAVHLGTGGRSSRASSIGASSTASSREGCASFISTTPLRFLAASSRWRYCSLPSRTSTPTSSWARTGRW